MINDYTDEIIDKRIKELETHTSSCKRTLNFAQEHDCKYCEYKCTCNRGQIYPEDCDGCGCNYEGWR